LTRSTSRHSRQLGRTDQINAPWRPHYVRRDAARVQMRVVEKISSEKRIASPRVNHFLTSYSVDSFPLSACRDSLPSQLHFGD
jgi:hypothetical protein